MDKWKQLFDEIKGFNYVVQRNWENEAGHDDLDLFVSLDDCPSVELICRNYPLVDVRYEGDGYYPREIEKLLLSENRVFDGYRIPTARAHFISLYYHNTVHKQGNPYADKLRQLFLEVYPPTKCIDPGVGFYL